MLGALPAAGDRHLAERELGRRGLFDSTFDAFDAPDPTGEPRVKVWLQVEPPAATCRC